VSSFGLVKLKEIWAFLDNCAPGYSVKTREHNFVIYYQDRSFPSLPRGPHGKRDNPGIQLGIIKQMVKQLRISPDCVKRHLPQLKMK
jgi:hypothetical protein